MHKFNYLQAMGPFTNDVSREGEGGGWPISDERKGGCVDLVLTRGREGVQNPENLADVICERPLSIMSFGSVHSRGGHAHGECPILDIMALRLGPIESEKITPPQT